jgi:hypothetical protein
LVHGHLVTKVLFNLGLLGLSHVAKVVEALLALCLTGIVAADYLFPCTFSADWLT